MLNFLIILISLVAGFLVRQTKLTDASAHKGINIWVIYIALPAVALKFIPQIDLNIAYLYTILLPFIVFGGSFLFFKSLNLILKLSNRNLITLILVSGLSNTSFVGFPLIITFFGEEYLKIGIVSDQTTFFILSSAGVILAIDAKKSSQKTENRISFIVKRVFTFPPLIACIIAVIFRDVWLTNASQEVLTAFASTVSPLALFSIGMQLSFKNWKKEFSLISYSLFYKLILAPAVLIVLTFFIGLHGTFYRVSVFEMVMPSLVATSLVIQQFGLNTKLANSTIGVSVIIGLFLSFIWHSVIITLL
ncbi:AEC family transporter [Sphingobacterium alkalisoli]|uniref:AEC family transporter n=1 Tax=Sphingobacterium alkalisoli TaxID=1874115 RepID=A0A4U0H2P0_9SPHI|nr:AEC family transporter [Sphingobacterium alkalisoli]TJY65903.1 AEC family transporter [Sphingobacterium alkalisoli]GGH17574.1 transporter [Sphingobacterium alkalisoli]